MEFAEGGKRVKRGRDEGKLKQAGRAAATLMEKEERKTCWGKKKKGSSKKRRSKSCLSRVLAPNQQRRDSPTISQVVWLP